MQTVVLLLAIGALAIAAYGDVRTRLIPNRLVCAIGVLGLVRMILAWDPIAAAYTFAAAAVVLLLGVLLFWRGMLGGGDAKLLTATVLLVGHHALFDFLFVMALSGAVLALAVLAADKLGPWLRSIPLVAGVGPARAVSLAEEKLDQWLPFVVRPAPNSPGAEPTSFLPARRSVPYGVAIAAAGILILVLQTISPG